MRHVHDDERRARLGARHALATPVASPEAAVTAMAALHATEAPTVYLSCWARVPGLEVGDVDRALYTDRTVVKQLAMRRTLFAFPRELLPAAWPSASARVARTEHARTAKDLVQSGVASDGDAWLAQASAAVLEALADAPDGLTATEVRAAVPMVDRKLVAAGGEVPAASRLLTLLAATGEVVRGLNEGGWYTSRPRWTLTRHWLGEVPEPLDAAGGYRELVRSWLTTFGPGTEEDLVWWLGSTKAAVRTALADLGAEVVALDGGAAGWLLADDLDPGPEPEPWVALLPVLDPTVMGWKGRDFYLGPHRELLFDRNGNAGTTAWVDGRLVGCWVQDGDGAVQVRLVEEVAAEARDALDAEAERLTTWLDGLRIPIIYKSPAMTAPPG